MGSLKAGGMTSSNGYLAVANWKRYQVYDLDEPPWIKLWVHVLDDKKVQRLQPLPRLLWFMLLPLAARYQNALPYNVSAIAKETHLERHTVAKSLEKLLEMGLLRRTKTPRRVFEVVKRPPAVLVEAFIQNGGYQLTEESLVDEMVLRGVCELDRARLLRLARELSVSRRAA
jgi:hypothetical protein